MGQDHQPTTAARASVQLTVPSGAELLMFTNVLELQSRGFTQETMAINAFRKSCCELPGEDCWSPLSVLLLTCDSSRATVMIPTNALRKMSSYLFKERVSDCLGA